MAIRTVLFDKDGTIIDLHRTWDIAVGTTLRRTARSEDVLLEAASRLEFDLQSNAILAGSPLIAESNAFIARLIDTLVPIDEFFATLREVSRSALAPAIGLPATFSDLQERTITLGVVTNDYEVPTREQMNDLGWAAYFDCVVGSDSGFGAKPDPAMILGALELLGSRPEDAVLVGDTSHDIRAGMAAGVTTVIVGNGEPVPPALSEMADVEIDRLTELVSALEERRLI